MNPRRPRVFFVDDEPEIRAAVERTLTQEGFDVACFALAADCLNGKALDGCQLLITDLKMPNMDGLELLARVRRMAPWLPVVVVTGHGDISTAVRTIKNGAVDFLQKPLDREELLRVVGAALRPSTNGGGLVGRPLTRTETRVLQFLLDGKNNKQIAGILRRSERTIEVHRSRIMRKYDAHNLVDLVRRAGTSGPSHPESRSQPAQ